MQRSSTKIFKKNFDIYLFELINIIITSFQHGFFSKELIMAKFFQFLKRGRIYAKMQTGEYSFTYAKGFWKIDILKNKRINVSNKFSEWETILRSVRRISVLEYATYWDHVLYLNCCFNRIYIFDLSQVSINQNSEIPLLEPQPYVRF